MKHGEMIIGWVGYLPIVVNIPTQDVIWENVGKFMNAVRIIGSSTQSRAVGV
ncbi:MAG: hypothetical protein JSV56_00870 [Methanomassiliicoccales archaeon]|nr:MAG: hypothetical protein JSV56_00870 [Methanomassiliicoccales archaeon]